jgi:hypothetical protein
MSLAGMMTQVVVKTQHVLRKEQATLLLANKRDINEILKLYYAEGWVDRGRDDLEFIFETSAKTCFKFVSSERIVGVTFATSAGDGIYYPTGTLIGSAYRKTVNFYSAGAKYAEYLSRIARLEVTYATRNVVTLYRDAFDYQSLFNYRGAIIDPSIVTRHLGRARAAREHDFPAVLGYNRAIYKADREPLIRHFVNRQLAQTFVLPSGNGGIDAYAMVRKLPKEGEYALGPVLANDRECAIEVIAAAVKSFGARPIYIEGNEEKLASLLADGLGQWEGTITLKMFKGDPTLLEDEARIYGIFSRYIS